MVARIPRVLMVDDEPKVLTGFQRLLQGGAFTLETYTSPLDALRRIEQGDVDLVVADDMMPEMTGLQLLAHARDRSPGTKRVMLTGGDSFERAVQGINEVGLFRYLRKPCGADQLRACIEDALRTGQSEGATHTDAMNASFSAALDALWMAAQPIVDVAQRTVRAYEMLVRCRAPGFPHPGVLLETAERLGRVPELESRIMGHVAGVLEGLDPSVELFVNLHASTLGSPAILGPLQPYAKRVVLEITERASLDDQEAAIRAVNDLRALGFRIAIDDLGAGYASLTSVATLRPDIVKLDMQLVRRVVDSRSHAALVGAVLSACKELDIAVVAEGIETPTMRDELAARGCTLQQGYLFARPGPPLPEVTW